MCTKIPWFKVISCYLCPLPGTEDIYLGKGKRVGERKGGDRSWLKCVLIWRTQNPRQPFCSGAKLPFLKIPKVPTESTSVNGKLSSSSACKNISSSRRSRHINRLACSTGVKLRQQIPFFCSGMYLIIVAFISIYSVTTVRRFWPVNVFVTKNYL